MRTQQKEKQMYQLIKQIYTYMYMNDSRITSNYEQLK